MAASVIQLKIINFNGSFCVNVPEWTDNVVLVANAAQNYTAPANCAYVFPSSDSEVWYCKTSVATASVPAASNPNGTGSAPLRNNLYMAPGDQISICSAVAAKVAFQIFKA